MQGIPQDAFLILVAVIGAIVAIPAFVALLAPGRATDLFGRRWAESFAGEPPAEGKPTQRLVVLTALLWLVVFGGVALLALLDLLGVLAPPPGANPDSFPALVFGGAALIFGGISALLRRQFHGALHTISRMVFARATWQESLTPGVTLAISLIIAGVGLLVVIYGFTVL